MVNSQLEAVQASNLNIEDKRAALERFKGEITPLLPPLTMLRINGDKPRHVSILRNDADLNMSSVFDEKDQLVARN